MKVVVVNYEMGNIYSILSVLSFLEVEHIYSNDPNVIEGADRIILPGVGSYKKAMQNIALMNLDVAIKHAVLVKGIPVLGICLGMQIMGKSGTEDGFTRGLGFFDGIVEGFNVSEYKLKIPHTGYNEVQKPLKSKLYQGIDNGSDFYFVHSYRMATTVQEGIAYCNYGEKFVASFEQQNIYGTQFHPEKSQMNGILLLKNFIKN